MLAKYIPRSKFDDDVESDMFANLFSNPKAVMAASAWGLMSQNGTSPSNWARSFVSGFNCALNDFLVILKHPVAVGD